MAGKKDSSGAKTEARKVTVIEVLHPGALPGKTVGDIVRNPTPEQIAIAKKNKSVLRIREE